MFGAVDEWLTRSLAGIQQAPNSIDYRVLDIKPAIVGNIKHVEATYRTTRGWIKSQWDRDGTNFTLKVKIPYGSTANVHVPGINITSDNGTLIHAGKATATTLFKIESGSYTFNSITDALNEKTKYISI